MSSSHQISHAQKRRSTRLDHAVPVAVQGVGAYREPYQDQVSTLSISCHGCTYNSKYEVIQGELVYLDVRSTNDGSSHGSSRARVKWVQNLGGKVGFQVAVELEVAGNIWGICVPAGGLVSRQCARQKRACGRRARVAPGRQNGTTKFKRAPIAARIRFRRAASTARTRFRRAASTARTRIPGICGDYFPRIPDQKERNGCVPVIVAYATHGGLRRTDANARIGSRQNSSR